MSYPFKQWALACSTGVKIAHAWKTRKELLGAKITRIVIDVEQDFAVVPGELRWVPVVKGYNKHNDLIFEVTELI